MRRPSLSSWLVAASLGLALPFSGPAAAADPITVVASIKPVHSLVAGVMQGIASPHLIVKASASPHSYSLKPSDAKAMQKAKVVVWVGERLEAFLESSLASLASKAEVVELAEAPGLTRLAFREGGPWEARDDHDAEHHDDEHRDAADEDGPDDIDQHLWLDPDNAKIMVAAIAAALVKADPDNAAIYLANSESMNRRLDALTAEIESELAPVKDKPFIVFHDAYQYFDVRFGLRNAGSVTVNPERQPGAARLKEIQAKIKELGAGCVFAEPQFEPRLIQVVIEGTDAKVGLLDPLGADLPDGPELYFELMRTNAAALKTCLIEAS